MMAKIMTWLQSKIDSDARILDIGRDARANLSPFYAAEMTLLQENGCERSFVTLKWSTEVRMDGGSMTDAKPLHRFETIVLRSFEPVCMRFGLTRVNSLIRGPECVITFENATAGLAVHCELGTGVWVAVGRLHRDRNGSVIRREFYDLSFFLDERGVKKEPPVKFDRVDNPGVPRVVEEHARNVSLFAADVLEGDVAILSRIRERAERNLAITEAQLYRRQS